MVLINDSSDLGFRVNICYFNLVMDLDTLFWQMMELSVKRLFDTVESIHDEMYYLRDR